MDPKELLELNPLLSDRVRLVLMTTLAAAKEPLEFKQLLESLELTKGNLSSHMRKLEEDGLVKVHKEFLDRKPRTTYSCTKRGQSEITTYFEKMQSLLQQLQKE